MQLNKIKSYFWENMSLSRRLAFESELEVNAELKKEYLIYKSIHTEIRTMTQISEAISDPNLDEAFKLADEAISEYNKDKLEEAESFNEFDSSHQEIKVPGNINKNKKNKIRKLYLIVSSAAAILLIALMFRVFIFETNPDKLFENYYSPAEMALNNTRGSQENLNASLILSYNYYNKGDFTKADTELNKINFDMAADPLYWYLKGLIELENKNYMLAINNLSNDFTGADPFYIEKQWYLGLCYLKLGEIDNAQSSLFAIQHSSNVFQSDAKVLLRKLRRLTK
ncbi:MAG: hypothetical protein KAS71_16760, partial [Bacteroidales bacterium]|nr:hypothetical protein [Bacteroidales bacterium]